MYPGFASIAEKEGFPEISKISLISSVEKGHENRDRAQPMNLEDETVFKRNKKAFWRCRNCGYIHEGTEAPVECPACQHEQAYFEILKVTEDQYR